MLSTCKYELTRNQRNGFFYDITSMQNLDTFDFNNVDEGYD